MRFSLLFLATSLTCFLSSCGLSQLTQSDSAPRNVTAAAPTSFSEESLPENFPNKPLEIPRVAPPKIGAPCAIVVDALTGKTLYQKNADDYRQVASTQKLVTALVVAESGNLNRKVKIQPSDTAVVPTKINFRVGEVYSRNQLLHALLIKSGNDAAKALARDIAGSEDQFCRMMNNKAIRMGMRDSRFCNPHGLTEVGQHSTARDMAKAALHAYRNPVIRECINTREYVFTFNNGRSSVLKNTNRLLRQIDWCTGMKTGTTDAAGRCLICSGGANAGHAIVVVFGASSATIWKDSANLLRWAIGNQG